MHIDWTGSYLHTRHTDHVLGLDDIRPLVFKSGEDMNVYGLRTSVG